VVLGIAGIVGLAIIIEIVSRLGIVSEVYLPHFSSVIAQMVLIFGDPGFLYDLWVTLLTWFIGLTLSTIVAVPVGILLGLSPVTYRGARAPIELVRTMPAVALIPLVMLALGQTLQMQIVIAMYAAVWPILFNTMYGVRGVDPKAKDMARVFGISRAGVIGRVVIPAAGPFIATGVRISSSIVLIVIITVGILAGGSDGLGAFIAEQRAIGLASAIVKMYAAILVTGLLGLAINSTLGWAERRWLGWDSTTRNDA
jgi:NitT/TauT family transport system permease protein